MVVDEMRCGIRVETVVVGVVAVDVFNGCLVVDIACVLNGLIRYSNVSTF